MKLLARPILALIWHTPALCRGGALLRNPGFVVLDEPIAAVDTDMQSKRMDAPGGLEHKKVCLFA
jgi:ABC-type Mn2+/Zn2+ transport system ATPase subunit